MKKILKTLVVIMIMLVITSSVFADVGLTFPAVGTPSTKIKTASENAWATVVTIVQILAFAAIVFAGVRYMFAAAEEKADLKKGLMILVVGAVLVFSAASVVGFIQGATANIIG